MFLDIAVKLIAFFCRGNWVSALLNNFLFILHFFSIKKNVKKKKKLFWNNISLILVDLSDRDLTRIDYSHLEL